MSEGDPCPVCGWAYVREEHVPENPDPEHKPDSSGTQYVHLIESIGNGRFRVEGCTQYQDGSTEVWTPPEGAEKYQMEQS